MISEQSQQVIKQFLTEWWADLTWKAHETVAGAQLPRQTPEQLYDQLLGHTLRQIAAAAEGHLPDEMRDEVHEACQQVCEWMWARPGMPAQYTIPWQEWAATPMGSLVLRALLWAEGDELITMTQASELSGRSLADLSDLVRREAGRPEEKCRLHAYRDPMEPNPTKALRLRRSEVLRLPKPRRKR